MNLQKENTDFEIKAEQILDELEINAKVPDELLEKVMAKRIATQASKRFSFDYSKYLQIAVVFAAAILIGVIMGKNANVNTLNKKEVRQKQALIELREKHHFSDQSSFGKL